MVPNARLSAAALVTRGAALSMLLLLSCMVVSSLADTLPSFVKLPQNQTGISGGIASFMCHATGEPKPRITWTKNGKTVGSQRFEVIEFDDGSGSVLRIQPLRMHRDEAIYECTATNSVGEINTSAKLTVLEEDQLPHGFPSIDMGPQLRVVEKYETANMYCAASGNPEPEISWYKDMLPVDINSSNGRIKQLRRVRTNTGSLVTPQFGGLVQVLEVLQIENTEESDQGKYECVPRNNAGTRYSFAANLYVRASVRRVPPRFSIPPTNQEVMPGESVNLTCVAVGSPMPYVKWMMGTEDLTREDEIPLGRNVLEVTNIRESANYTCVAMSTLGMIEATAQVTVKALPIFVRSPDDLTGVSGGVASFVCQAKGKPKPRITWLKNGKTISSQSFVVIEFDDGSGSVLRIEPLHRHQDDTIFECTATNSAGQININAKLTVLEEDQIPDSFPTIDMGPQLRAVEENQTALMLCTASGNPDPKISWLKDMLPVDINSTNGRIKQLRSGVLQIENSEESDQGKYECVATNREGTRYSAPANLYVRARRMPPRFSVSPRNQEVMPGESVNLTCVAVGLPMPYVKWMMGTKELTREDKIPLGRNVLELTNIRESANYTCLAMSLMGFVVATAQVTVKALPKPLTSVTVTETTATSVTLTWDSENTDPVSYIIQYKAKTLDNGFQRVESVTTTRYSIEGLRPYSEYQFRVTAVNNIGHGLPSDPVETRTREQAPSSPPLHVQAHMLSPSAMLVQWEPPEEPNGLILGYRVYYSTDLTAPLSAWQKHNTDDSSLTAISGLIPNTTYNLGVLGFTSVGDGPLSDILQVNMQQRVLPKPLTSLTVTETTATSVTLTWDSGNTVPVSYIIQYRAKNSDSGFQEVKGVVSTRYSVRGLRPYSEYQFRVMAVNSVGHGPPSNTVETRTKEQAPSSPPLNVQAHMLSPSAMLVQWEPPEEPNGLILGYRVYYSADLTAPLSAWQKRNTDDSSLTAISGLTPDITYSLRVLGFTSVGNGPLSDILQVNVQQRVPAQPSSFDAEAEQDDRIMLTWLWPVQDPITKYELEYLEVGSVTKIHIGIEPTNSYAVDGLKPDTLYRFILAARSEVGLSDYTQPIEARTAQSMPAAPPRKLEVEALNSTAIRVTWKPPLQQKQHGQIRGYQVIFSRLENGEPRGQPNIMDVALPEAQEAIIGGLLSETTYSVTVAAYTTEGDGARSKAKVVTTSGAVPGKPDMMIRIVRNNAVIVWKPPTEMAGPLIGYQLQYKRTDDENFTSREISLPFHQYYVSGLHKGATYIFRLSARNRAGIGEACTKEISTPEDIPSGFPTNLQVRGLTQSSMQLTWEPPLLAERNGKIISYMVQYWDINSQQYNALSHITTETYLTIQDLRPDTTYDITVQAYTSNGWGPQSPSIHGRTLPSP